MPTRAPRVALVQDWLVGMRGAERVLETFARMLPQADLFTLVHRKGSLSPLLESRRIGTTFLQRLPGATTHHRWLLPLMPMAIESLDLTGYDFVLSSSYCVAKGVVLRPETRHVSYCHTPMRYAWEQQFDYFGPRASLPVQAVARVATSYLRLWDEASARRVDTYVANSHHVARRIRRRYGADAEVVHPPVDCARFSLPQRRAEGGYYVMLGALAPYKRADLAIEACERTGRRLLIGGGGQEAEKLRRRLRKGGCVELVGEVPGDKLVSFLQGARAFLFPGEEDFGIAPVEAQACGVPVVAYGCGGALETVVGAGEGGRRDATGVFFREQTVEGVIDALERFERLEADFDPARIRANALRFDRPRFIERMRAIIEREAGLPLAVAA